MHTRYHPGPPRTHTCIRLYVGYAARPPSVQARSSCVWCADQCASIKGSSADGRRKPAPVLQALGFTRRSNNRPSPLATGFDIAHMPRSASCRSSKRLYTFERRNSIRASHEGSRRRNTTSSSRFEAGQCLGASSSSGRVKAWRSCLNFESNCAVELLCISVIIII